MPPMSMEPAGPGGDALDLSMAVSQLASNSTDLRLLLKLLGVPALRRIGRPHDRRAGRQVPQIRRDQVRTDRPGRRCPRSCGRGHLGALQHRPLVGRDPHPKRTGVHGRVADQTPDRSAVGSRAQRADSAGAREHRDRRDVVSDAQDSSESEPCQAEDTAPVGSQVRSPALPSDLPKDAAHRLEECEHGLFTSDLSVNEFLLVKEAGFIPLGFVMGCRSTTSACRRGSGAQPGARQAHPGDVHRPGTGHDPDGGGGRSARSRRHRRCPPRRQLLRVGQSTAEFIAIGTAVKAEDGSPTATPRASPSPPISPGQDFWTLGQAGHVPWLW